MQKNTPNKKDLNPLQYNHKHASMRDFAEHINLRDVRLSTLQAHYRQMELVRRYFGSNPKCLSQKQIQSYILHLKVERSLAASSIRQAIAACRAFYCGMLGILLRHAGEEL